MRLKQKIESGEFIVLAEIEPRKGWMSPKWWSNAKRVKDGIDAFVVPEMSNAVMRMSSLGGAMVLQNEGLPTVFQVCCRDRNRLAIQGDLLAAYALGITSVMAVGGEDLSYGDHHQARSVYDIDLIDLIGVIDRLRQGRDMAGIELSGAPDFLIGTTAEAGSKGKSTEMEVEEMMKRARPGRGFLSLPPFSTPPFSNRTKKGSTAARRRSFLPCCCSSRWGWPGTSSETCRISTSRRPWSTGFSAHRTRCGKRSDCGGYGVGSQEAGLQRRLSFHPRVGAEAAGNHRKVLEGRENGIKKSNGFDGGSGG